MAAACWEAEEYEAARMRDLQTVLMVSALLMIVCGLIRKVFQAKWIEDYALPISLLGGMALSIPITTLVQSIVG